MPYQEPADQLSPQTRDTHLALESLKEELKDYTLSSSAVHAAP